VFSKVYAEKYPESCDPSLPPELIYSGSYLLTDTIENVPVNMGKLVLSPTRTYAPVLKRLIITLGRNIHGLIHCSGGAQTKILHFVDDLHIIKDSLFEIPPLFKIIQEESKTEWKEMYQVFNMGHRMEVYLNESLANECISISESFGIQAKIVGRVEKASDGAGLTIKGQEGAFRY
jgi:phosphoribosylformylglycinamidine cyclo-ligase